MKKLCMFLFIGVFLALMTALPCVAEQSEGEIETEDPFVFRPISSWVGERFVFLPNPASLQEYGYQSFKGGEGKYGHPEYNAYVGRVAEVVALSKRGMTWDIEFEMEDDGRRLKATAHTDSIHDIALVADIDNARDKWEGTTLWYSKASIATYNEETEEFGKIELKKYSPVKVVEIVAGWYNSNPVRFILQATSGEVGFDDVNLSGTNVSETLRGNHRFEDLFSVQNPRTTHKWANKVWAAIEEAKVFIGMTSKQAIMSWGKPRKINKTITSGGKSEQWVYSLSCYLYFENGVLTTIQK